MSAPAAMPGAWREARCLLAADPRKSYLSAMSAHSHQLHQGNALRDAAARRMAERGEQWTDMRASIFDALAAFDASLAAAGSPLETVLRTRVPPGSRVLVAGDGPLPKAENRDVVAFAGDDDVVGLEQARTDGATHLAIPAAAARWLEDRPPIRRHVRENYDVVFEHPEFTLHSLLARRAAAT